MSDIISDAEKVKSESRGGCSQALTSLYQIRNKRLAKLGAGAPLSPEAGSSAKESEVTVSKPPSPPLADQNAIPEREEQSKATTNVSSSSSPATSSPNPFSQLGLRQSNGETQRINISPAGSGVITPLKREHPSAGGRSSPRVAESLEVWQDRTLGGIFRLSLKPEVILDSHGHPLHYVASVRADLEEQGSPVRLSTDILDQAILEASSNLGKTTPLDYLLACWKRGSRQYRAFKAGSTEDPKYNVIKEARRLCMSYCIFAVTMPDMFG